jgi:hypothetical protein
MYSRNDVENIYHDIHNIDGFLKPFMVIGGFSSFLRLKINAAGLKL